MFSRLFQKEKSPFWNNLLFGLNRKGIGGELGLKHYPDYVKVNIDNFILSS